MATTIYADSWTGEHASGKITQRAYLTYEVVTDNDTTYSIRVSSGVQQYNGTWNNIGVTCALTNQSNVAKTLTKSSGANYLHEFFTNKTFTYTKPKTTQSQSVVGTATVTSGVDSSHGGGAVLNKPSTVTYSFNVPLKTHWAVSYDANGGSGAPAGQTKWYNESLQLRPNKPTRSGYMFMGWNTKADGTGTTYQPNDTYTGNTGLTLHAQWKTMVSVKVSGAWKSGEPKVKVSGAWKSTDGVWVKANGTWKST